MPIVNGKEYPYTEAGMAKAAVAREEERPVLSDPTRFNRSVHHIPGVVDPIVSQYPRLSGYDWQVTRGDPRMNEGGGYLEFYPPDESYNPVPGKPTISIFDKTLNPEQTQQMVFGDMLHYLPQVDPEFGAMREQYRQSLTPEQQGVDRRAYQRGVDEYGENRPYDRWMDVSRLDAHLRGYLSPDKNNEWAGSYNPEQLELFKSMQDLLKKPRTGMLGEE
jgi:hypothetical protein